MQRFLGDIQININTQPSSGPNRGEDNKCFIMQKDYVELCFRKKKTKQV